MSFIRQDTIVQLLESVGRARRQELLEDLQFDVSDRSFPSRIKKNEVRSARDHHLTSEYDHRDLRTETNGGDDPCKDLSQLNRQLTQEGDMRVFFDRENPNLIIKIIRKRPLECNQGVETYSLKDENGDTLQVQADEILFKGEPQESSEDIYDHYEKVPFNQVEQRYIPPMDKWDVIFDATEAMRTLQNAMIKDPFNVMGIVELLSDIVYSSNVYPTLRDKRYSNRLKEKLSKIQSGLNGRNFISICGAADSPFKQKIDELRKKADELPLGKEKASILGTIQFLKDERMKRMKASVSRINTLHNIQLLKKAEVGPLSIDSNRKKSKKKKAASRETILELEKETLHLTREAWKNALSGRTRTTIPRVEPKVMWNIWNELISIEGRKPTKSRFKTLLKKKLIEKTSREMSKMTFDNEMEKRQQSIFFQALICHTISKATEKLYGGSGSPTNNLL